MTQSLSNRTDASWRSVSSRFKRKTLGRPIFPRPTTMPANEHVRSHSHHWGQITYISDSVMSIFTPQGTFVIPPQQALWIPPNVEHETFCRYGGHFRSVYIDEKYAAILGDQAKTLVVDALLKEMILTICTWPEDYLLDDKTERFIQVFIDRLELAPTSAFFIPKADDQRLLPIVSELYSNPGCTRTLEQWGEQVGASARTLNRLFHKSFAMSFSQWKQKLRALRAVEMLTAGETQQVIAQQLGFESSSAFNSAFKKYFGTTPRQYLKR
ncbi:helix-turn-helix transcriptional regulator [Pseudoalteromonas sp. R3]|uniref:AraC family transcriptional regulator n=1 Tax=Pseudoalteromonas sp. R3 TaxID=1709477 RepID=UPI0006B6449C|nr:helix-turn-helix transcriptional regulator [Pseudoalteromonas sp. R3]AZZ96744.1 AraC family transcriptional regulator [Pseudoalteromonas sp. R3]